MKKKFKDGGAVGNGMAGGLSKNNVRPWIFENDRRLAKVDLKLHELEYMDLTRRENQLINQARVRKILQEQRQDDKNFRQPEDKGFSGEGEMVSDDSDGTAQVELNRDGRYISISAIIALSLLILFIF